MPLFAVICRDRPDALTVRMDTRPAHLDFLQGSPGLRMAGPLIEDGAMMGSLLIVEADDLTAARDWAAGDPYGNAGLFASVDVTEWKKVIG